MITKVFIDNIFSDTQEEKETHISTLEDLLNLLKEYNNSITMIAIIIKEKDDVLDIQVINNA